MGRRWAHCPGDQPPELKLAPDCSGYVEADVGEGCCSSEVAAVTAVAVASPRSTCHQFTPDEACSIRYWPGVLRIGGESMESHGRAEGDQRCDGASRGAAAVWSIVAGLCTFMGGVCQLRVRLLRARSLPADRS